MKAKVYRALLDWLLRRYMANLRTERTEGGKLILVLALMRRWAEQGRLDFDTAVAASARVNEEFDKSVDEAMEAAA